MTRKERIKNLQVGDIVLVALKVSTCTPAGGGTGWTNDGRNVCVTVMDGSLEEKEAWVASIDIQKVFTANPQWIDLDDED